MLLGYVETELPSLPLSFAPSLKDTVLCEDVATEDEVEGECEGKTNCNADQFILSAVSPFYLHVLHPQKNRTCSEL